MHWFFTRLKKAWFPGAHLGPILAQNKIFPPKKIYLNFNFQGNFIKNSEKFHTLTFDEIWKTSPFRALFGPFPTSNEDISLNNLTDLSYISPLEKYFNVLICDDITRFIYKQRLFSTQPQCCLTFSRIQPQILLKT